jgi:hypothetical protein
MISTSKALEHYFCVCCSGRVENSEDYCPKCQTPVCLSQSAAIHGGGQQFISILGASNAGKTVYSGLLLDILCKGPPEFRGVAASPFAVDLQEYVIRSLEQRAFPEKTPSEADTWQWLHCKLSITENRSTRTADLISPDFAGEAIAMEICRPGLYPVVENVVSRSSGIMLLCDSLRVRDHGASEDLFATKLAAYIAAQHEAQEDITCKSRKGPSIAVIFTKCDACPEATGSPRNFASSNMRRLFDFCEQKFHRVEYFTTGVAGSTGLLSDGRGWKTRMPFHVQPHGILEPLKWLLTQD